MRNSGACDMKKGVKILRRRPGNQADAAYQRILAEILRGRLPLGAAISRRGMASELAIGLQPVTEALQRLEADGIVESRPRIGTRVKAPTELDVRGHYIVREALESQAARLFAEKASRDEKAELAALAEEVDAQYHGQEMHEPGTQAWEDYWFESHTTHMRFHLRIAECTGCEPLCEAMKRNQILIFNWLYDIVSGPRTVPPRWHSELVDSLNSGDVEAADAAMRRHVRFGMEQVVRRVAAYSIELQAKPDVHAAQIGQGT